MNVSLEKVYLENLEKYVGKKLNIIQKENKIKIIDDVEMSYMIQGEANGHYLFYSIERNQPVKIAEYYSEEEMKRGFAIAIKGFFNDEIDYSGADELETLMEVSIVEKVMESHIGSKYFSIMNPQKMKINLEVKEKNKYNIYLLGPNNEYNYIEENIELPFAFERFYNEALFLKVMLGRIEEYQIIFEDKLSEEDIYSIIK